MQAKDKFFGGFFFLVGFAWVEARGIGGLAARRHDLYARAIRSTIASRLIALARPLGLNAV